uniref:Uncharacterized protein n=1 Tax=Timema genevievae TaxID=629358 RepID=A0A7R9K2E6_TIMGE|nr:unnamed protein product [Timema genevievae]
MIDLLCSENTGVNFVAPLTAPFDRFGIVSYINYKQTCVAQCVKTVGRCQRCTTPDCKDVALKWEYNMRASPQLYRFQDTLAHQGLFLKYTIEDSTGHEVVSTSTKYRAYTAFISGLRVSTNYSFEVHPVERMRPGVVRVGFARLLTMLGGLRHLRPPALLGGAASLVLPGI